MSSPFWWRSASRFWIIPVLALMLACSGFAFAAAVSISDLATQKLVPSSPPMLLGAITQAGRKGWACKPERAAAAKDVVAAELPATATTP